LDALDEAEGQAEASAEEAFAARHLAGVGLVVVASQMEQAMEHEYFDLGGEGMSLFDGLTEGGGNADGEVAGEVFSADASGGEGENVGGLVFAAKLTIEAANGGVGGEQDGDLSFEPDGGLGQLEEVGKGARGGQTMSARKSWRGS
jgi:hypothetical protein